MPLGLQVPAQCSSQHALLSANPSSAEGGKPNSVSGSPAAVLESFSRRMARQRQLMRRDSGRKAPSVEFGDEFHLETVRRRDHPRKSPTGTHDIPDEEFVESWTKLRLTDWQVSAQAVSDAIARGKLLKLGDIKLLSTFQETAGDRMIVAVLVHKTGIRATSNRQKYMIFRLADLRGTVANMFLFDEVMSTHRKLDVGSVLLVLNPDVLMPSRSLSCLGMRVDRVSKVLKMAASVDLNFCGNVSPGGSICKTALDERFGKYCDFHIAQDYMHKKAQRMELALGTSWSAPGDPVKCSGPKCAESDVATRRKRRPLPDAIACQGSYIVDERLLVSTADSYPEPKQKMPKPNEKHEKLINHFMDFNSHGASLLRRALQGRDTAEESPVSAPAQSVCRIVGFDQQKAETPEEQTRKKAGIQKLLERSSVRLMKRQLTPK